MNLFNLRDELGEINKCFNSASSDWSLANSTNSTSTGSCRASILERLSAIADNIVYARQVFDVRTKLSYKRQLP